MKHKKPLAVQTLHLTPTPHHWNAAEPNGVLHIQHVVKYSSRHEN